MSVTVPSLAENEDIIKRGLVAFVDVGTALRQIRDERQYRDAGFASFEEYCRVRWRFSHQRASQMIQAAEVATIVADAGLSIPANEAQARELVPVLRDGGEAAVVTVLRETKAEHGDRLTAQNIRDHAASGHSVPTAPPRTKMADLMSKVHALGELDPGLVETEDVSNLQLERAVKEIQRATSVLGNLEARLNYHIKDRAPRWLKLRMGP